MKLQIETFCHFVNTICNRPKFYTLNGTFGEVIATIESFAKSENLFNTTSHHGLHPFQKWLANDPRFANSINFADFRQFRDSFEDDNTALDEFARMFTDFCKTLSVEEDDIEITITESEAKELVSLIEKEKRFSKIVNKIELGLYQNANNRNFLSSNYNIFKDKK